MPTTTSPELSPIRTENRSPFSRLNSPAYRLQSLAQAKRSVTGPLRMILVGDGRTEQRHDAVTGVLVYGTFEAVDPLRQDLEEAVHHVVPLLGINLIRKIHRTLHVHKEDGYLLSFPFECGLGLEDLVGEVLGGVGLRLRVVYRRRFSGLPQVMAAFAAEILTMDVLNATFRTVSNNLAPQPAQNFLLSRFSALALRTFHFQSFSSIRSSFSESCEHDASVSR